MLQVSECLANLTQKKKHLKKVLKKVIYKDVKQRRYKKNIERNCWPARKHRQKARNIQIKHKKVPKKGCYRKQNYLTN